MNDFKFDNGSKVESNITGFKGIITARADHLNGCNRYFLTPPVNKVGALIDGYWFDEDEIIVKKAKVLERKNNDRGGFPSSIK